MKEPNGFVIYRGPSVMDGKPIVAVALLPAGTANRKTGAVVQTYILADNGQAPTENLKSGDDVSICGDCKQRPFLGGECYVVVVQGPNMVWKSLNKGNYPVMDAQKVSEKFAGKTVRLGTYGDPAAVPVEVWQRLLTHSNGHMGYTHQWQNTTLPAATLDGLRGITMASCDNETERAQARAWGWRSFTVLNDGALPAFRESVCPASEEAGKKLTCIQCKMCDGANSGRKGSILIQSHGTRSKWARMKEAREAQEKQEVLI